MTERSQFVRLFDEPKTYRTSVFQAFWKPNGRRTARLGITIKGRLGSVWRMRLKRIVREWFRINKDKIGCQDLNIVVRVPAKLDHEHLERVREHLARWVS